MDRPIGDTHDIGGIMLSAALDYTLAYADMLRMERTPVYGHLVVARAAWK